MLTFLFEQYGYYPNNFKDNVFEIGNWKFELIEIDCDDEYIKKVDEYSELIKRDFSGKGPFIIKTRFNKNISIYDNKKYLLLSINKCIMSLEDLNKFHYLFKQENSFVDLKELLKTWENRIFKIETEAINALRIDSVYYKENLEIAMFCLGLAQNALQYLSEAVLDYDNKLEDVSLVHKRIKSMDSFEFFNPFNFVIDHPLRDLVNLYKNNYLVFEELTNMLEYYKLDSKLATIFMARMMYSCDILDLLEDNIIKRDLNLKIKFNIDNELLKIKKMYLFLKNKYNIRPIVWLDN